MRFKADFRVALDSHYVMTANQNSTLSDFWNQMQRIRPTLLDTQFGFDFVIPGTQGAIKFGGWYLPSRKEAMAELRLF